MKVTGWKALRYNRIEYITVIRKQEKDMRQSPTKQRHNVFPPPHVDGVPWLRRQFSMKENNTHYLKNIKLHRYGIICLIYLHTQTHLFISKRNVASSFSLFYLYLWAVDLIKKANWYSARLLLLVSDTIGHWDFDDPYE